MRAATSTYGDVSWERLRHLYKYHHRHTIRTLAIARLGSFDASPASQDAALVRSFPHRRMNSSGEAGMPDRTSLTGFAATFETWAREMQFSEAENGAAAGGFKCARRPCLLQASPFVHLHPPFSACTPVSLFSAEPLLFVILAGSDRTRRPSCGISLFHSTGRRSRHLRGRRCAASPSLRQRRGRRRRTTATVRSRPGTRGTSGRRTRGASRGAQQA